MNTNYFTRVTVLLLVCVIAVPGAFFVAPQRAHAGLGCLAGIGVGLAATAANTVVAVPVSNAVSDPANSTTASTNTSSCIEQLILLPIARAMVRSALQAMTAVTINYISGNNGTGRPSFVVDLQANLQGVGDSVAGVNQTSNAFIPQVATAFESPFAGSISSALRTNYLENGSNSTAGVFAANQSTLAEHSPNPQAYLAGDWSQGGTGAWFSLVQNNSYSQYDSLGAALGSEVAKAQANRTAEYKANAGFLSWCGSTYSQKQQSASALDAATLQTQSPLTDSSGNFNLTPSITGQSTAAQKKGIVGSYGSYTYDASIGQAVGDPCTNSDGTPGQIKTPGSVIAHYADLAAGMPMAEELNLGQDLNSSLGAISMALTNQILGGVNGFIGAAFSSNNQPSVTSQIQNASSGSSAAVGSALSFSQQTLSQINEYDAAWNTIGAAAQTASTTVASLQTACAASIPQAQKLLSSSNTKTQTAAINTFITTASSTLADAQTALTTEIAPVIADQKTSIDSMTSVTALANKVNSEAMAASQTANPSATALTTLNTDVTTLTNTAPPSSTIASAQSDATPTNGATANPTGSLTVAGGTTLDRMNLITTNARALTSSACTVPSSF